LAALPSACASQIMRSECGDILAPPAQYDHAPYGPVMIFELSEEDLHENCGGHLLACAIQKPRTWQIYIERQSLDMSFIRQSCLLRHEFGHTGGWPADHAGGVAF
jgi:hypothetical protein